MMVYLFYDYCDNKKSKRSLCPEGKRYKILLLNKNVLTEGKQKKPEWKIWVVLKEREYGFLILYFCVIFGICYHVNVLPIQKFKIKK